MSKISGKETKPEIIVRKYLFSRGFRYRKNDEFLPGKPDIVLPKHKTVIFVHGCFWHSHKNCIKAKLPDTRNEFWKAKITKNVERDFSNYLKLKEMNWKVLIVWQCQIKNKLLFENRLANLITEIIE